MRTSAVRPAALIAAATLAIAACGSDGPTAVSREAAPTGLDAHKAADPRADRTTATARWTRLTHTIIGRRPAAPPVSVRALALVAVAQYNAVVAAETAKPRRVHPSEAGAVAGATAAVLAKLYPAEQAVLEAQLRADSAAFPNRPSERHENFAAGVAVGAEVGAAVLARAATDRSDRGTAEVFPVAPTLPGVWYSAPPPAAPVTPLWGQVRPWLLTSGDQFRPPPPPRFGSRAYRADLAEVQRLTAALTPRQRAIAEFWGTPQVNPAGWNGYVAELALELAARRHMDERKTARVLAVLQMAEMDALIGCWDAKYYYRTIRPWQVDARIGTPIGQPNFPSYPSGHSCAMGAAGVVLAGLFPSEAGRMYALIEEAGLSRIYAGLHFRFDVDAGQRLGAAVARLALAEAPRGHEPIPLD